MPGTTSVSQISLQSTILKSNVRSMSMDFTTPTLKWHLMIGRGSGLSIVVPFLPVFVGYVSNARGTAFQPRKVYALTSDDSSERLWLAKKNDLQKQNNDNSLPGWVAFPRFLRHRNIAKPIKATSNMIYFREAGFKRTLAVGEFLLLRFSPSLGELVS